MQITELWRRVQPQIVGQPGAQPGEDRERVALPARGGQRPHEEADRSFAQWLGGDQRLDLGDGLGAAPFRQQCLGMLLDRPSPQLSQAGDVGRQRGVVELRVRRATPERECRGEAVAAGAGLDRDGGRGERWSANAMTSTAARSASSR